MNNKKVKKIVTTTTTVTEEIIETNGKTHIVCILDRSGSMQNIISDSIGGFNSFIKSQKDLGDDAVLTLALFDNYYELIYNEVDIKEVEEITSNTWYPRGMTALYDAIGKTINTIKSNESKRKSLYDKTLVCIVTDGEENDSREYNSISIKSLISESEKEGWEFIYLGANQDAFAESSKFGISYRNTLNYTANTGGVSSAFDNMVYYTTSYRTTGNGTFNNDTVNNTVTTKAPEAYTLTTTANTDSDAKQKLND